LGKFLKGDATFFDLILAISDVLNREKEPIDLLDFFNDYSKMKK
jgi:hypothetical protein